MKNLDKKAIWIFFFKGLFLIFFVCLGIWTVYFLSFYINSPLENDITLINSLPSIIVFTLLSAGMAFISALLRYKFYLYEMTEDSFHKKMGIIWKKQTRIPYERIQNVNIERGVGARILGLSAINVYSAGYSGYPTPESYLPGLSKETAKALQLELIKRAKENQ